MSLRYQLFFLLRCMPLFFLFGIFNSMLSFPMLALDIDDRYWVGGESGSKLIKYLRDIEYKLNGEIDFFYFYVEDISALDEIDRIKRLINKGSAVLLDGTRDNTLFRAVVAAVGGVAFDGHVALFSKSEADFPFYHQITVIDDDYDIAIKSKLIDEDYKLLADEVVKILVSKKPQRNRSAMQENLYLNNRDTTLYVEMRYVGFPCQVGKMYEGNLITGVSRWQGGMTDPCNGGASVSLVYTVDMIRSLASPYGGTQNAKYLRITLDPSNNSGPGWHLVDQPRHHHSWFFSWSDRETWFGPVADRYSIDFYPRDQQLLLYRAIPGNQAAFSRISNTSRINVGMFTSLNIGVNNDQLLDDENEQAELQNNNISSDNHSSDADSDYLVLNSALGSVGELMDYDLPEGNDISFDRMKELLELI